ncbi:MAG: topoisomerase DNA-binding C4 zinc finger domain-containing protein [Deltaproteobacteria bacterium]|nr:topoisomerase DNA-binding C4 zinc finger domain-containing protein [Deltaproteobacteria bacterium]
MTAWRLAADCPACGAPLRLRRRRADGGEFLGCSSYPRCDHAEEFDPYLDALAEQVDDLRDRLASATARLADREREQTPESVDLRRELRGLIALAHPDRWPHAADLAHEVTARLTALRARVAA